MEKMVLERQENKDNQQFAFLKPGSAYYAYYQATVRRIRSEEVIADVGDKQSIDAAAAIRLNYKKAVYGELPTEEESTVSTKKKRQAIDLSQLEPPPPELWVIEKPHIPAVLDDIIKLSAQFIARNGSSFQIGLAEREQKNPQFDFLRPNHPLNGYFKRLVQDYTRVLLEKPDLEALAQKAKDKRVIADQVMKKVQWERVQRKNQDIKRQEEEAEKTAMAQIDWHDFAIVQTIEFEDDLDEQPAPQDENGGANSAATKRELLLATGGESGPPGLLPLERDQQHARALEPLARPERKEPTGFLEDEDMDMDVQQPQQPEPAEDLEALANPSNIKTPKFAAPVGGQAIDLREAPEQMKILLSNPIVLEQRKIAAAQQKPTNLTEDRDIINNLREFASRRTDMFGDEEAELGRKVGEKRSKVEKPIWDGHADSVDRITQELASTSAYLPKQTYEPPKLYVGPSADTLRGPPSQPGYGQPVRAGPLPTLPNLAGPMPGQPQPQPPVFGGQPNPMMPRPAGFGPPQLPFAQPAPYGAYPMMPQMQQLVPQGGLDHTRPPLMDEPVAKKQKTADESEAAGLGLVPERDWLQTHSGPVNIVVTVPNVPGTKWPLHGQTLRIQALYTDSVQSLKDKVAASLGGMPANKQKLKTEELGFLKDSNSLAFYNAKDGFTLELGIKERGGRKK